MPPIIFMEREVAVSLERHERGEARVVPIILRPCAWNMTPLSKIEALPAKGKRLHNGLLKMKHFTDIAQSIGEITTGIIEKLAKLQVEERDRRQYAATQAADHLRDQHRWAEAQAAYMDAIDLFKPGFEPQKEELERDLADCKQQHDQETATTAFQQRRTTFENKLKQAGQLFNVANWVEARSAWQELLTLHEAEFSVSLASINAKLIGVVAKLNSRQSLTRWLNALINLSSERHGARPPLRHMRHSLFIQTTLRHWRSNN
ncbi:MAG: hypothetical protein IPN33_18095 [Saprospiraceae bacterium]|nr:hypothetical protein [Saprospiraceae bacterium]